MEHDRVLASDIGVRDAGSDGDRRAAEYLTAELSRLGYQVAQQTFQTPIGAQTSNVVAVPQGIELSDTGGADPAVRYLIVGGHRDTVPGSPGANDNASGTAVSLEIARAITVQPSTLPIVFVLFGAEERQPDPAGGTQHHIGSRHYVQSMSVRARSNLVAMLNVDMVGYGPGLIAGRISTDRTEATVRLVRIARELGIPMRERVEGDRSDNGPFVKAKLNAGWVYSGEDPVYHSPRDTYDHVQPQSVNRAGAATLATARTYA